VTSNTTQPSYPSPPLPTIPNHLFAFLLRKKAKWMEKMGVVKKGCGHEIENQGQV
jgi:hypothetical protein